MKILVTGPNGMLGSTLMQTLASAGYEPAAYTGDIRDSVKLKSALEEIMPAWVVHTAARIDVGWCEKNPEEAYEVNVVGTKNIIAAAAAVGTSVLFLSTASVFSGRKGNYTEDDALEPMNVYSRTKQEGEAAVAEYAKGTTLRLTLLGAHPQGSRGKNFFEWIMESANANKDLQLFSDQLVNQISNWSAARFIQKIIELPVRERVLHIGTRKPLSKAEVGKMILKHFPNYSGTVSIISSDDLGDGLFRPKEMWLNTGKAAGLLGPMPTYEEELALIFDKLHR